jgi:signal transduction histidine kinase
MRQPRGAARWGPGCPSAVVAATAQRDQLRAEWSSVVAHDLRQPVDSILLITQTVARKKREPAEYAKLADQIAQSAGRLNGMINDLLDSPRLEAGQLSLSRALGRVDLPSRVRDSVERSELAAPARRFKVQLAGDIPILHLDGERITERAPPSQS